MDTTERNDTLGVLAEAIGEQATALETIKPVNHQFSITVLGQHIASFWAARYTVLDPLGGLWFADESGESVLVVSQRSAGVEVMERLTAGVDDWHVVEWPEVSEPRC